MIEYFVFLDRIKPTLSDQTMDSYMKGIKPFIKFLISSGYTKDFQFPTVKKIESLKETYTDEELDKLLVKPNIAKCLFAEYRDWVIICHILATGNRESTVFNFHNCDVNFTAHEIKLNVVKNRRAYIIPMSSRYEKILKEYMSYRGGNLEDFLLSPSKNLPKSDNI
jgi:integrase/recombinase XerD